MTLALSYRHYVEYAAEQRAAGADASLDERIDDDLAHDTIDVCRRIALNGMIGLDAGLFDDE